MTSDERIDELVHAASEAINPWGESIFAVPFKLRYSSRWRRLLAHVWPPARRRHRIMREFVGMTAPEMLAVANRIQHTLMLYGNAYVVPGRVSPGDGAGAGREGGEEGSIGPVVSAGDDPMERKS